MIEAQLRSKIQPLFCSIGKFVFVPLHLSPNTITFLAFATGILAGVFVYANMLMPGLCMLLASGLCDVMDGTVARLTNSSQKTGAYMDLVSDRMVEAAIILGFTFLYPQHYLAYILFLIAVLLHFSTFLAAGALFANEGNKSMHHDHSIVERAEAFVVFALMFIFPAYIFELLITFSVIVLFDGLARFWRVIKL